MNALEESRLESVLDIDRTVTFEGSQYTYHPTFEWGTGDFADERPVLVLNYNQEAGQRDADQPLNDLLEVDLKTGDNTVDRHRVSRVQDILQVTVSADEGYDSNGVPAHVRVQQMVMSVWRQFRFDMSLNESGPNGERPMLFGVSSPPSGPGSENDTIVANFVVAANYNIVDTLTQDAVEDAETTENVN